MPRKSRRWAWGLSAGLLLLGLLAWAPWASGPGGSNARAEAWSIGQAELGEGWRRVPPPVDLANVERYARGIPGLALPREQHAATWRDDGSGAELTAVTLVFEGAEEARSLMTGRAAELLAATFGLQQEAVAFEGAGAALAWRAPHYHAVAVQKGRFVAFVGTTLPPASPLAAPEPLAATLLSRPLPTAVATVPR